MAAGVASGCQSRPPVAPTENYYHPADDLGPLFHDVQAARIFPDGKTFVDMPANASPAEIAAHYRQKKGASDFDLKTFVLENFQPPSRPRRFSWKIPLVICSRI